MLKEHPFGDVEELTLCRMIIIGRWCTLSSYELIRAAILILMTIYSLCLERTSISFILDTVMIIIDVRTPIRVLKAITIFSDFWTAIEAIAHSITVAISGGVHLRRCRRLSRTSQRSWLITWAVGERSFNSHHALFDDYRSLFI